MKPSSQENPDLTAYALGELHARQARDIHSLLAACPVATHELEQVEAVTDALRQGAPIPQERLRPEQRHAVLYPASLPRRMAPLMPRPAPRRASVLRPFLVGVLKAAAVLTLTGAAYLVGRHSGLGGGSSTSTVAMASEPVTTMPKVEAPMPAPQVKAPEAAVLVKATPAPEKAPVVVIAPAPEPQRTAAVAVKPAVSTPATVTSPALVASAPVVRPVAVTSPGKHTHFVNASRQAVDQFALAPAQIRPLPAKVNRQELLAAPAPLTTPEVKDTGKPRTPDLYIHSWKAEVTTCPWNEGHRLLRVSIQLPADQPAALTPATYPLRVTFDPKNVREYRQLCERHQPAAELRQSGTHVVWYEFLPNGDVTANKTVATVTLDKGRFTTQAVGPFDSTKLAVQDRGEAWQNAREDFIFDSAVVSFGLLMRGLPQTPQLNHALVLSLAEKAQSPDPTGDRRRFIKLVREAALAAGL
ncbi:YfbK domain-containing protein [Prosthecobacter dejongeii]|uniref:Uncharacterized protein YfbK C-terminal domain-containing protein n=1 Tax=Prosthecobacter dejongeii TaxID=48465 RepID=A0A7W7YGT2_9BACT|nr:YfbK domain-containing protein [Prosthecobacter dejongeii]MBB5035844.1 hypothetical protein [Prosthecobacter dejongeii]